MKKFDSSIHFTVSGELRVNQAGMFNSDDSTLYLNIYANKGASISRAIYYGVDFYEKV